MTSGQKYKAVVMAGFNVQRRLREDNQSTEIMQIYVPLSLSNRE